ncbi:unnamed protein product [Rotaria sordida]|uniref:Autophagy-related protein 27 n=1 Tax=Rotaria sordida TaxID=392033 RepID=A0A819MA36_9BILA|nr:unnamed protein product [Rotaria sordida]CAF3953515.1 unnamed protein product [Rotaria sordida]CAF3976912.1 unnamed protein product [Rotaria sordida]
MATDIVLLEILGVILIFNIIIADDPCKYETPNKGLIDLSSIGKMDGTPVWKDIPPDKTENYGNEKLCTNVAGCQIGKDGRVSYSIGTQASIIWKNTLDDMPSLVYTSADRTKQLFVDMLCIQSDEHKLEVHGETKTNEYHMTLSTKCACWNGCKDSPKPTKPNSLTTGAVLIIIFVAVVFLYLITFISYNHFRLQRSGIDLIPHRKFWIVLPGYAKDGIIFVYHRVICSSRGAYQSV